MAVAVNRGFYHTLPTLQEVEKADAEIAWLIYNLRLEASTNRYVLERHKTVYSRFETALVQITRSEAGDEENFVAQLQAQLDRRLDSSHVPETLAVDAPF